MPDYPYFIVLMTIEDKIKRYIAFDIGAESGRCVVGKLSRDKLKLNEVYRFPTHTKTRQGDLHWDLHAIFNELKIGLSKCAERMGRFFDGISVDTWGLDYVLLDGHMQLLNDPYHYRSLRTEKKMEVAFKIVSRSDIYHHTGIQFMQINTLYQLLADSELKKADLLLPIPNFLLYRLSGAKKGEYTIVSTTQLSDPGTRDWSWDLIRAFDFPRKIFPEVVEAGTNLGNILPEISEKTGIDEKTPVIAGASHDTAAAVAAVPAVKSNWAYLSSGTWSLMGVELQNPLINRQTLESNFTNEGGVTNTVRFLKNIAGLWLIQECRRCWEKSGKNYSYGQLSEMASKENPVKAWINPDDQRFLKPGEMPEKVISFLRDTHQSYQENVSWITRCILESLAFKYRIIFEELQKLTNQEIERLHIVGGGIQNELLCQMTADAIKKEVIAGPVEGTVAGNIGIQAITTGAISDLLEFRRLVGRSFKLKKYKPEQSRYWEENDEFYRSLLP